MADLTIRRILMNYSLIRDDWRGSLTFQAGSGIQINITEVPHEGLILEIENTGGGGGGAPTNAEYLTLATNSSLTGERRFVPTLPLSASDGGANGDYTLSLSGWSGTTDTEMLYRNGTAVGSKTPAQARTWLSLVVGTNVQAWDAGLDSLTAADATAGLPYVGSANSWSTATYAGMLSVVSGAWKVVGLRESGGTDLGMGAVADGSLLRRVGTSIVGAAFGSVVQAWAAILDAIIALSSTGLIVRTGGGTVATRTITAGDSITITDGDGVAGNPTVAVAPGAFTSPAKKLFWYWSTDRNTISTNGPSTSLPGVADGVTDTYNSTLCQSTSSSAHSGPNCATLTRLGHEGVMEITIRTASTNTNRRLKVGYYTGTHSGSPDTPTTSGYYLLFRASTATSDTNWQIVHGTGTGSAYTTTDTGIAWSNDTTYTFKIETTSSDVTYTITNENTAATYSTTISTNLPTAGTNIGWTAVCTSVSGTTNLGFLGAYYEVEHPT